MELIDKKKKLGAVPPVYDPMKSIPDLAPAVGGGLAPAFNSGTVGENARYFGFQKDSQQNAERSAVGSVPNGAPSSGAPSEYRRQMGEVANFIGDAATGALKTIVSAPGYGFNKPSAVATATPASYSNEGRNYPNTASTATSPVSVGMTKTAQPSSSPQVALGMGKPAALGVTRFDAPGQSPLFTNMTDAAGMADNQALMNRGAPNAQNQAAMNALVGRSTAEGAQAVQLMQLNDQVAQAQAINALPNPDFANPTDLRDPANLAARSQRMDMQIKSGESPQVYDARMRAMQESQRLAAMQGNANADRGFNRDKMAFDQQIALANLGMGQQRVALDQQRVNNELATGQLSRDEKSMGISSAKQMADIQAKYMASTDPKERAQLAQTLRGLDRKAEASPKDNYLVLGGGQEYDKPSGMMRNVPQTAIDLTTGKQISAAQASPSGVPATYEEYAKVVRAANPGQSIGDSALKDKYAKLTGAQK